MRYILSQASQPILEGLANEQTLCAFDFDGTLAPIVDHPGEATLRDATGALLSQLAASYPCVILSGRGRADLLGKLTGVKVEQVIGNHGAEGERTGDQVRHHVQRWKAAIEVELGSVPGLWVEDKGLSLAVHYRQSPKKAETQRLILQASRSLERARVFGGKQVVNLVVDSSPHKGAALAAERDRLHCSSVLYVGDDENDEDAFALTGNTIAVRVGRKQRSRARYYLRNQAEIDNLLQFLVSLRSMKTP
jgi:trehalose 6-phosphate phosphatase